MPRSENDWRNSANCREVDPDFMQPEYATPREVEAAKAVCRGCPVILQCRREADSQRTEVFEVGPYGVWAGQWWGPGPKRQHLRDLMTLEDVEAALATMSMRELALSLGVTRDTVANGVRAMRAEARSA